MRQSHRDRKSTRLNSSHTVIYTLSLHDALPISMHISASVYINDDEGGLLQDYDAWLEKLAPHAPVSQRSEEHTSELQSHSDLHSFPTRRSSDLHAHLGECLYQ